MKNLSVIILVVLITLILALVSFSFQVRETEKALVSTFGEPTRQIDKPGWYWKWPMGINTVHKFDSRVNLYVGGMKETTTKGGEPIVVTSYVAWKIGEPLKFLETVGNKKAAEKDLGTLLSSTQNSVIGEHYFSEFVNSDPDKISFEQIENEMFTTLSAQAEDIYGIEIKAVGLRQLGVPQKVTAKVFDRMKADRNIKTEATIAEGEAEATRIRTNAESKRTKLLALVEAEAKTIRGAGDAEAATFYSMLDADPEFAIFLQNIEALKKILKQNATIVLGADTEPMGLLKQIPDIEPKK